MKNFIAVAAGIAVVTIFFGKTLFPSADIPNLPKLSIEDFVETSRDGSPIRDEAWSIFEQYREYARLHDIESVNSLSYQLSSVCLEALESGEQSEVDECNTLMNSVFLFTETWQKSEFTEISYDTKQIVLETDYIDYQDGGLPTKTVIFFTRTDSGEPRVLGIKFCFGKEDQFTGTCVNTDPDTRDIDGNGWWDEIESRFYK